MIDEVITLDEYVDLEESLKVFVYERTMNSKYLTLAEHSIKSSLGKLATSKFIDLSWQTMDILHAACSSYITVNGMLYTHIDIVFKRHPIHVEVARYLVINEVPETVYINLRSYVMANSEEAKAILTMGSL